jgi:hypothetical protein
MAELVNLTIDGRAVRPRKGTLLIEARARTASRFRRSAITKA